MKKLIIFLFIIASLSSCDKDNMEVTIPNDGIPSFLKSSQTDYNLDASINIISNDYTFAQQHPVSLSFSAHFKSNDELIFVNDLKIGDINVSKSDNDGIHYSKYFSSVDDDITEYNKLVSFIGDNILVEVNDDNFPSLKENIYFPKKMNLTNFSSQQVSKATDLSLNWEVDNNGDEVGVLLMYQKNLSRKEDSSLPNESISIVKNVDESLGSVTFTVDELAQFPSNGILTIFIGRGNQKIFEIEGKKVAVNIITYQMTHDFTIVD